MAHQKARTFMSRAITRMLMAIMNIPTVVTLIITMAIRTVPDITIITRLAYWAGSKALLRTRIRQLTKSTHRWNPMPAASGR